MVCPICNVALVISERQGIEIDYCPKCRGVWLDRGELDKLIERSAPPVPEAYSPAPGPRSGYHQPPPQPHYTDHQKHYYHGDHKRRRKSFLEEVFDFD